MRRIFCMLLSISLLPMSVWAGNSYEPLLDTVTLELNAEQWVTTQTALVTIGVNASVTGSGLEKTQNTVLAKLGQISNKGEWHIVSFNRSLNQSGLEQVQVSAQARLPASDLGGLRDRTKAITKPGETYTLDNVEFTASDTELRNANTALRESIYQQAKNELGNLTKYYPDQHYYIHRIDFVRRVFPQPQPVNAMYMKVATAPATNLSVGDKLVVVANVVLASAPSADVMKVVHA